MAEVEQDSVVLELPQQCAASAPPAGFWLRVLAKLADRLVMYFAGGALLIAGALLHSGGVSGSTAFWFLLIGLPLVEIVYFSFFTSHGRQTLGYRLAGIRVETQDNQRIGFTRALARSVLNFTFFTALIVLIGALNYLLAALRPRRTLHDMLTGTQVVRVAPSKMAPLLLLNAAFVVFIGLSFAMQDQLRVVQAFFIPSGAMENTLRIGDKILVNTLGYRMKAPQFGDVAVFKAPDASGSGGQDFIKRCVGTPGDVIEVRNRQLFRNGKPVQEPHAKWSEFPEAPIYSYDMKIIGGAIYSREYVAPGQPGPWVQTPRIYAPNQQQITQAKPEAVPSDKFIMLGDHRNNSNDSHAWGLVPRENFVGKTMFIYWPFNRMQGL